MDKQELNKRIKKALDIAFQYGQIDGDHHKTWVIDQIVRILTGDKYNEFVNEYETYVRTKKGKIFKYGKGRAYLGKDNEIVNHSFNIKDLIEEGDIVNRQIVVYIEGEGLVVERAEYIFPYILIEEMEIKEILTHEQYERNFYRLENN